MTTPDADLRDIVDDLANALQSAIVLAAQLATSLRADAHDADGLYNAVSRAALAVHRLRSGAGGR